MADRDSEYQEARNAASSEGGRTAEDGCAHCHTGNWIHIRYEYPNEMPVTDAIYVVQKPNNGEPGGEVIAEGVLTVTDQSQHEFIHVDLGEYSGEVEVFFFDDPTEPEPIEEPAPVEDERAWYEKAATAIVQSASDAASWTGGVLAGDFNEEMSTGQIITNAVVTAIPVVDQVADVRDLVANGKALVWDKRYNEIAVWVGVFACLIGLVPSLGSLAKGVIKVIWRNAGDIGRVLVYINKALFKMGKAPNGYRFVRKLADDVVAQVGFVAGKFDDFLGVLAEKIALARNIMPEKVAEALATLETVRAMSRQKLDEAAHAIRDKIIQGLTRHASRAHSVLPAQSIVVRRATKAIVEAGPYTSWQKTMQRPDWEPSAPEPNGSTVSDNDAYKVFRRNSRARVTQWYDELLQDKNLPDPIRKFATESPDYFKDVVLGSFAEKPIIESFERTTHLYRVIGKEADIGGGYWARSAPADLEEDWRRVNAVRQDWNAAGAYVVAEVPPPPAALTGKIGPQQSQNIKNQVLPGGGEQIWFPAPSRDSPAMPMEQIREYYHTNWNVPAQALSGIRRAGKARECDL